MTSTYIGRSGILFIYESQNKYPGLAFLKFMTDNDVLQTSPGKLLIDDKEMIISIITQQKNEYAFVIDAMIPTLHDIKSQCKNYYAWI